jgi:phosphatidylserine decarboxylase
MLKIVFVPIHKDGYKFILLFALITIIFFLIAKPLGWFGVILTLWCVYFFRDPIRVTPEQSDLMVSPADGKVVKIETVDIPEELELDDGVYQRVSVFLNVFDVHVCKSPLNGVIKKLCYIKGKFFNASLDKASKDNERMAVSLENQFQERIGFVQIAGLVARRIRWYVEENEQVQKGANYGNIRFGSRMDVYIPASWEINVLIGQTMIGGETVIAKRKKV